MANFILCQIIAVFVFVFVFPKRTKHISCFEIILLLNVSPHSCNQRLQEKTGLEKKRGMLNLNGVMLTACLLCSCHLPNKCSPVGESECLHTSGPRMK